jgi:hypothetical protein
MKSIRISAAAALVIATAMIGTASAENQPAQQGSGIPNPGGMMGYGSMGSMMGIMGPGMMGPDSGGPGMMRWGASGPAMCTAMAHRRPSRLCQS